MPSFLSVLFRNPPGQFFLLNTRNQATLADTVLTAFDSASRRKGLLGRSAMPDLSALIIAPTNAIHTFFMKFPIDVAFVTRSGDVVKTRAAVQPWRMTGAFRAYAVIEMPAGALERAGTRPGDRLEVVQRPPAAPLVHSAG